VKVIDRPTRSPGTIAKILLMIPTVVVFLICVALFALGFLFDKIRLTRLSEIVLKLSDSVHASTFLPLSRRSGLMTWFQKS